MLKKKEALAITTETAWEYEFETPPGTSSTRV